MSALKRRTTGKNLSARPLSSIEPPSPSLGGLSAGAAPGAAAAGVALGGPYVPAPQSTAATSPRGWRDS